MKAVVLDGLDELLFELGIGHRRSGDFDFVVDRADPLDPPGALARFFLFVEDVDGAAQHGNVALQGRLHRVELLFAECFGERGLHSGVVGVLG